MPAAGRALAAGHRGVDTGPVSSWGSYSYLFGPLVALVLVAVLAVLLRWAFGRGHSLVQRRPRAGAETDYGLLVPVAEPGTFIEAEVLRRRLLDAGLRATLAPTTQGPRVLVFPEDERTARALLRE